VCWAWTARTTSHSFVCLREPGQGRRSSSTDQVGYRGRRWSAIPRLGRHPAQLALAPPGLLTAPRLPALRSAPGAFASPAVARSSYGSSISSARACKRAAISMRSCLIVCSVTSSASRRQCAASSRRTLLRSVIGNFPLAKRAHTGAPYNGPTSLVWADLRLKTPHTLQGFLCRHRPWLRDSASSWLSPLRASSCNQLPAATVMTAGLSGPLGSGWSAHDPDPGARADKPTLSPLHRMPCADYQCGYYPLGPSHIFWKSVCPTDSAPAAMIWKRRRKSSIWGL